MSGLKFTSGINSNPLNKFILDIEVIILNPTFFFLAIAKFLLIKLPNKST